MKKQLSSWLLVSVMFTISVSTVFAKKEKSTCFSVGYAYDYSKKRYYYSNLARYTVPGNGCLINDQHAHNEWNDYAGSEIKKYFNYSHGVFNSCECHGSNKPKKSVKKKSNKHKSKYRNDGFRIRKLKYFDPEDY